MNSKQDFKNFLKEIFPKAPDKLLDTIVYGLFLKYSKGRHYHNIQHVSDCLKELEDLKKATSYYMFPWSFNDLKLALWYHDVESTEEESIEYLGKDWFRIQEHEPYDSAVSICQVNRLIMKTKPSSKANEVMDMYIKDIDISILGKPFDTFKDYENRVRKEYPDYCDKTFCLGRAAILRKFLKQDSIYLTNVFRDKYEKQARKNLEASIEHLRGGDPIWKGVF
jgi:predicted metal-dependent HD superfamily phosphohydrolase